MTHRQYLSGLVFSGPGKLIVWLPSCGLRCVFVAGGAVSDLVEAGCFPCPLVCWVYGEESDGLGLIDDRFGQFPTVGKGVAISSQHQGCRKGEA